MDEAKKTEYMMKKRKDGTFSILRKTDSGPVGMFHKLDKKAADNIMKKLEGGADARDRRERGMPDAKGQRLFASFQEHVVVKSFTTTRRLVSTTIPTLTCTYK